MQDKERLRNILSEGTLIGSRAWGGSTEESDFDVVLTELQSIEIENIVKDLQITYTEYEDDKFLQSDYNYKFSFEGKLINIIVVPEERIAIISRASGLMSTMKRLKAEENKVMQKEERIEKFHIAIQFFEEKPNDEL